jgi:hypothetical protein
VARRGVGNLTVSCFISESARPSTDVSPVRGKPPLRE